jgi:hypothetical protein
VVLEDTVTDKPLEQTQPRALRETPRKLAVRILATVAVAAVLDTMRLPAQVWTVAQAVLQQVPCLPTQGNHPAVAVQVEIQVPGVQVAVPELSSSSTQSH